MSSEVNNSVVLASCHGPINWMINKVHELDQQQRHLECRAISALAGPIFSVLAINYQILAMGLKAPVVLTNYTFLLIPIKVEDDWVRSGSYLLPPGFELTEMFKHLAKIVILVLDIVLCPIVGLISPKALVDMHVIFGLVELQPQLSNVIYVLESEISDSSEIDSEIGHVSIEAERLDLSDVIKDSSLEIQLESEIQDLSDSLNLELTNIFQVDENTNNATEHLNVLKEDTNKYSTLVNAIFMGANAHRANFLDHEDDNWNDESEEKPSLNTLERSQSDSNSIRKSVRAQKMTSDGVAHSSAASAPAFLGKVSPKNIQMIPADIKLLSSIRNFQKVGLKKVNAEKKLPVAKSFALFNDDETNDMLQRAASRFTVVVDELDSEFGD